MIQRINSINPVFSILICTIESRKEQLDRLIAFLQPQLTPQVEILINSDAGTKTVGQKRNELVDDCSPSSKFCAYIDDDDEVSPLYVSEILVAIKDTPDCVGIEGIVNFDGNYRGTLIHSLKAGKWRTEGERAFRTPNHLNPIRTDLVKLVRFREINAGEDSDFCFRILPHLKKEVHIPEPIYTYNFSHTESQTHVQPSGWVFRNAFGGDFNLCSKMTFSQIPSPRIIMKLEDTMLETSRSGEIVNKEGSLANYIVPFIDHSCSVRLNQMSGRRIIEFSIVRNGDSVVFKIMGMNFVKLTYPEHTLHIAFGGQKGLAQMEEPPRMYVQGQKIIVPPQ